jgi:hypothetical protein
MWMKMLTLGFEIVNDSYLYRSCSHADADVEDD